MQRCKLLFDWKVRLYSRNGIGNGSAWMKGEEERGRRRERIRIRKKEIKGNECEEERDRATLKN